MEIFTNRLMLAVGMRLRRKYGDINSNLVLFLTGYGRHQSVPSTPTGGTSVASESDLLKTM